MLRTGYIFGSVGVQGGVAALALYLLNFAVWSALTALIGGAVAFIGLGLIMWALCPRSAEQAGTNAIEAPDVVKLLEHLPHQAAAA